MRAPFHRRERGLAHIELAIVLSVMGFLLPLVFSFGQIFYLYSVVKQANSDAAASLAVVPMSEWSTSSASDSPMKQRARQIVQQALASASVSPAVTVAETVITCKVGNLYGRPCGGISRASAITVNLTVVVPLGGAMAMFNIGDSTEIVTTVTVPYTN